MTSSFEEGALSDLKPYKKHYPTSVLKKEHYPTSSPTRNIVRSLCLDFHQIAVLEEDCWRIFSFIEIVAM